MSGPGSHCECGLGGEPSPFRHAAACLHFLDGSCRRCEEICPTQAIDLSRTETVSDLEAESLIVATGYTPAAPPNREDYTNYYLPNIMTGWELEELTKQGGF